MDKDFFWRLGMEDGGGGWRRMLETEDGDGGWRRRMEADVGDGGWRRRIGNCVFLSLVCKKNKKNSCLLKKSCTFAVSK